MLPMFVDGSRSVHASAHTQTCLHIHTHKCLRERSLLAQGKARSSKFPGNLPATPEPISSLAIIIWSVIANTPLAPGAGARGRW